MEKDIIINKLRVLVNHLPFMNPVKAAYAVGKANAMLDNHFEKNGGFIKIDISEFAEPRCNVCGESISSCRAGHSQTISTDQGEVVTAEMNLPQQ